MNQETLVLGLNPAWQRLFILDELRLGEVRRIPRAIEFASGKGINCARVLQLLGGKIVLSHFLGTGYGNKIFDAIADTGIRQVPVWIASPTRICTTIVTNKDIQTKETTELIEPSPELTPQEMEDFRFSLEEIWESVPRIALCGSNPKSFDMNTLVNFDFSGKRLYIDAVKDIDGLLEKGVEVLKLNMEEYCELLQRLSIPLVTSSPQFWKIAATAVLERLPIRYLIVTDEENPVRVFYRLEGKLQILRLQPPSVEVVNCIGAGDSFLAGWIYADSLGLSVEECLVKATAVASACCEVEQPWEMSLERIAEMEKELSLIVESITE